MQIQQQPKLLILKKRLLTEQGHYRYYSPFYNPNVLKLPRSKRPKSPIIDLNDLGFTTEKQLCWYLYKTFGEGDYRLCAFKKGRKGLWTFWKGVINEEGFMFDKKRSEESKAISKLKEDLREIDDEKQKQNLIDEMDGLRETKKLTKTRYGFYPFLKMSGRRGQFIFWQDFEIPEMEDNRQVEDTGVWDNVDINVKKEEFEVWEET